MKHVQPLLFIPLIICFGCNKEQTKKQSPVNQPPVVNQPPAANKPPVADAGPDQTINLLLSNLCYLDGGRSFDPDGVITSRQWRNLSGPAPLNLVTPAEQQTWVNGITTTGRYIFELTVTDNGGLSAKDTTELLVRNNRVDSIRFDSLQAYSYPCEMYTPSLSALIPPGASIQVYIRYYWGSGTSGYSGPWTKIDTIPDSTSMSSPLSSFWYWYEYNSGFIKIHYPRNILCEWDGGYHDVWIKWG